ncbi:auxin-binding protein ABP19a-like [Spinacia oleracea]|uniref:Germin-like protein n=1 Tax=Spinacia oleracea TaxID=3562 RepID=A0A9R0IP17_SPIOL|nr:auxin-binding protein ABP19a-like [Spinacia oleracea]
MMIFRIIFLLPLLISISSANIVFDYCVGDLSLPTGPTGYSCKDPAKVTVDDFVYSGLRIPGSTKNLFKFGASTALASQFPGLNGMGISMVRADMDVGGAVPIHTHRVSELIIVVEGTIIAGFIDTNNTAFYKTLNKGDMMIFPPILLHFQVNVGSTPVVAYATFPSENPGVQLVDGALFQNTLPSEVVEKVTLLDQAQVKKLKKIFGGSN